MAKIDTIIGTLDTNDLENRIEVEMGENYQKVMSKWLVKETGQLVKEDVMVNILTGFDVFSEQGEVG